MTQFSLAEKHAVVTGGCSGIGHSVVTTFVKHGAYVHILDLDETEGRTILESLGEEKASFHSCDVSDQDRVDVVFKTISDANPIHILVNNAGIAHVGNVEDTTQEDIDRVYAVNVKGVYNSLRACVPIMKSTGGGVILNISSIAASVGLPDRFAYSMSKGAVASMTLSVARDYLADSIRCNSISPARVHTPFVDGFIAENYPGKEKEMFEELSKTQPIGRMGTPEEIANLALFLCSDEAAFITGVDYAIDGGFTTLNT